MVAWRACVSCGLTHLPGAIGCRLRLLLDCGLVLGGVVADEACGVRV